MRHLAACLCCLLLMLAIPARPGRAESKVALVIGNSDYQRVSRLANPANDARAIGDMLQRMGFSADVLVNLDRATMQRAIRAFATKADGADVALVFYAGHGIQATVRDRIENYLLPVDAVLADVRDAEDEAISVQQILERLSGARNRVLLLDACRDNPFAATMRIPNASRSSATRGLARTGESDDGALIAFATNPGQTAADGVGNHSPFTAGLLAHMATPGMEVRSMLREVRRSVYDQTRKTQLPWTNDGLLQEIYLAGPPGALSVPPAPRPVDSLVWDGIKDSNRLSEFESFVAAYPSSAFVPLARAHIAALRSPPVLPVPPRMPMDQAARQTVQQVFSTWSADPATALAFIDRTYASTVFNYGQMLKRPELLRLKQQFIERWPDRRYTLRPDTVTVDCNPTAATCRVDGQVDWITSNPAHNTRSTGLAKFTFSIAFRDGTPTIVAESGNVVQRQ